MKEEGTYEQRGKHVGLYVVEEDTAAHGLIVGDCRVGCGFILFLHGTVTGNLLIEDGAKAIVHGTVSGSVENQGEAHLFGTIGGLRDIGPTATSKIDPKAVVGPR